MSAVAIARYLVEFDARDDASASPSDGSKAAHPASKASEAFAEGFTSGKAAAEAELAAKLKEQQSRHENELATARRAWAQQEGANLGRQLAKGLEAIEAGVGTVVARILEPFVAKELRDRAIADLVEHLGVLLAQDGGAELSISGRSDLLEALRIRLADRAQHVSFLPSDGCEVRVSVGQTVLETRLAGWLGKIEGAAK